MQGPVRVYDPDQVIVAIDGIVMQGFADGEMITIAQVSDAFLDVCGTDGEVARSKSNDRRATVTVKLLQTSNMNDYLTSLHLVDLNAPGGAGIFNFMMQDLLGTTMCQAEQAWIVKYPDNSMDRTAKSREWQLRLGNATRIEGGNIF